jgi:hypothetical protein
VPKANMKILGSYELPYEAIIGGGNGVDDLSLVRHSKTSMNAVALEFRWNGVSVCFIAPQYFGQILFPQRVRLMNRHACNGSTKKLNFFKYQGTPLTARPHTIATPWISTYTDTVTP